MKLTPRCVTCGEPIRGHYAEINGQGPYCERCYQERGRCDVCGAPLDDTHQALTDGRRICSGCHASAVYDQAVVLPLARQISRFIGQQMGLTLNVPTGLILVGRDQLIEIVREQVGEEAQVPTQTLGIYARRGIKRGIYVQSGLPRTLLIQVAAHEWGHAWQGENCPLLRDPLVREGFAEWVAYKTLVALGAERERERMIARPDIYGQGVRRALEVEALEGEAGVVEWCRKAGAKRNCR